jgi:predicted nucleic acid-binding protein
MNSVDTNILMYATNEAAPEKESAQKLVREMLHQPDHWILAEQVLIELYGLLRNSAVLEKPLTADRAWNIVSFYRERARLQVCCYELDYWPALGSILKSRRFPVRKTFDAVLAVTLLANDVDSFYTRNTKDFAQFGFKKVVNPID